LHVGEKIYGPGFSLAGRSSFLECSPTVCEKSQGDIYLVLISPKPLELGMLSRKPTNISAEEADLLTRWNKRAKVDI